MTNKNKTKTDMDRFYKAIGKMANTFNIKETGHGSYVLRVGFHYDGTNKFKFLPPDLEKLEIENEMSNKLFNLKENSDEREVDESQESDEAHGESSDAS